MDSKPMKWYSAYCFEVTVHQSLTESFLFKDCSDMTLFPANNSSNSFHRTISSPLTTLA